MIKLIFISLLFLFFLLNPLPVLGSSNSFVTVVNPVRGEDFWANNQNIEDAVFGQMEILKKFNMPATWLVRFDVLRQGEVVNLIKGSTDEAGLFLEVTPGWTKEAGVEYHQSQSWHMAKSSLLTGYEPPQREKLIDAAFENFKKVFSLYPKSVGAWWIDSYSLSYMQKKYGITGVLIVADQYTTDNYQIWGQYFSTPYYPSKVNALHPAQSLENKLPVVMFQWAARDPVNSYGNGVFESTFSVQPNDYLDYHNLDTNYFSSLVDTYTKQQFNQFGQLTVGLENSYSWQKYAGEYENQIKVLSQKSKQGQFSTVTMEDFASWYRKTFPQLSPAQIIMADDPLGTFKKTVWFMNPYYRAGWFYNQDGSVFRDIRQYIDGEEELCHRKSCDEVNFATFATRVLDEVSFGHKWVIDEGKIAQFDASRENSNFLLTYTNEGGKLRKIEFLDRDIGVDGKISSIDGAILDATKENLQTQKIVSTLQQGSFRWSLLSVFVKIIKFSLFLFLACMIPGLVMTNGIAKKIALPLKIFLSGVLGLVSLTLVFYLISLINLRQLIFAYVFLNIVLFIRFKLYLFRFNYQIKNWFNLTLVSLIFAGVFFQIIPTFKNGLNFPYGYGFWGPNTHDGIWHISLINSLVKSVPPENPILAGETLKNYHFFYDLLVATTNYFTQIPVLDLVFRFYPILFSLFLGLGTYYLVQKLFEEKIGIFKTKLASLFSIFLVYFAGSFGWIVSYIKERNLAGESAFWANQSISFNLNPPFAMSLLIILALFYILSFKIDKKVIFLTALLSGALIGFKAYGAVLALASLFLVGVIKRQRSYLVIFIGGLLVAAIIFLVNFKATSNLLVFAPFWFVHSMIDSPDRVGWVRLSLAREVGLKENNWFKFLVAEVLSLGIFIAGNLGIRIFSLVTLVKFKAIVRDSNFLFMFVYTCLSLSIPLIFIQSGNPWNTIQFTYYGLYMAAIGAGLVLSHLFFKLPKILSILIIFAGLILAPINSVVTATYYLGYNPHALVGPKELQALEFLSKQPDGIILTYPYEGKLKKKLAEPWPLYAYDSTAYVGALSRKSSFLEDEPQNQILLTDYKKRLVASKDFFLRADPNFLIENKIKYLYLPKIFNVGIKDALIDKIFENEEVEIFKVNN